MESDFAKFKPLAEYLGDSMLVASAAGNVLWSNSRFREFAKYKKLDAVERVYIKENSSDSGNIASDSASDSFDLPFGGEFEHQMLAGLTGWPEELPAFPCMWEGKPAFIIVLKAEDPELDAKKRRAAIKELNFILEDFSGDFHSACEIISKIASRATGFSQVGIWLFDESTHQIVNETYYSLDDNSHNAAEAVGLELYPVYISRINSGITVAVPDTVTDDTVSNISALLLSRNVRSFMHCPIMDEYMPIGVIRFDCLHNTREWTPEDFEFASAMADLTEKFLKSREVNEIERLKDHLLSALPDTAFRFRCDPPYYCMEYLSEGCLKLTGYSPEDLMYNSRLSFMDLVHHEDLSELEESLFEKLQILDDQIDVTFRVLHRDGGIRWIWSRCKVVETSPDKSQFSIIEGFFSDISEKHQRQEAEHANEVKSAFLAQMSHEIRTPINAVMGISEILRHDKQLTPSQLKYVNDIHVSTESLLAIINSILDLSKLESGKMTLNPVNFSLNSFLDNICSMGRHLAANKNLAFEFECTDDISPCLYGDDVRLRQIMLNLLSNAIKFTDEGRVKLKVDVDADNVVFSVSDSGIGIKSEDQEHLFEPFKRLDSEKNRNVQGTGLGLSICKNMLDLIGGSISVKSEYGSGSTFIVIVPKVLGDEKMLMEQMGDVETLYSPDTRILVVDDNEVNLTVASGLLKVLHGIICETASSGMEAVKKVSEKDYHLVFMDHMMPEMDGIETTARIRALGGKHALQPIVALTANAISGAREKMLAASMNDFMAKPFRKRELAEVLCKWLPKDLKLDAPAPRGESGSEAASNEYSPVLKLVMEISEINFVAGFDNAARHQDVYEQTLKLLNKKIPTICRLLEDLLEDKNLGDFSTHVHGMKSSLASVGAMELSRLALELEKASARSDADYCREHLPSFTSALAAMGCKLDVALQKEPASSAPAPADKETVSALLASLPELLISLEAYDYEAIVSGLGRLEGFDFGQEANTVINKVKDCVESFDYGNAAELLRTSFPQIRGQ